MWRGKEPIGLSPLRCMMNNSFLKKVLSKKKQIIAVVLICVLAVVLFIYFSPKANVFDEMYCAAEARYTKNPLKRLMNRYTFDGVGSTNGGRDYSLLVEENGFATFYIKTEEIAEIRIDVFFDTSTQGEMLNMIFVLDEAVGKYGHYRWIEYNYYPDEKALCDETKYDDFPEYTKAELQKIGNHLLYDVVIKKWTETNENSSFSVDDIGDVRIT